MKGNITNDTNKTSGSETPPEDKIEAEPGERRLPATTRTAAEDACAAQMPFVIVIDVVTAVACDDGLPWRC